MTAEINQRDAARDGMGCIIDRWDGERNRDGFPGTPDADADHDERTELADSLIDYLIGLGWRRMGDDDIQQASWNEGNDEPQSDEEEACGQCGDPSDPEDPNLTCGAEPCKTDAAREQDRDDALDDEETTAIIDRMAPEPHRICRKCGRDFHTTRDAMAWDEPCPIDWCMHRE